MKGGVCGSSDTCMFSHSKNGVCKLLRSCVLLDLSASKAIACRATGRGLQAKGVRINEIADFTVLTEGAGSGDLQVTLKKPSECYHQSSILWSEFHFIVCACIVLLPMSALWLMSKARFLDFI